MNKRSIWFKIILNIIIILLILVLTISATFILQSIKRINNEVEEHYTQLISVLDWAVSPLLSINDIDSVQRLIENVGVEEHISELIIIDSNYEVLASNILFDIGTIKEIEELNNLFKLDKIIHKELKYRDNRALFALPIKGQTYFKDINSNVQAVIIIIIDYDNYYRDSFYELIRSTIIILTIFLLCSLIFIVFLRKMINQPLKKLQDSTKKLANGDYSVQLNIHNPLEFEQFAEIFNRMARVIESKDHALLKYNQNLEKEILERTQKLKDAQDILMEQEKMASLGQLAAGVAHEINNPVGFIMTNISTLKEYVNIMIELITKYETYIGLDNKENEQVKKDIYSSICKIREDEDWEFIINDIDTLLKDSEKGTDRIGKIVLGLQHFSHEDSGDFKESLIQEAMDLAIKISWNKLKYKCKVNTEYEEVKPFFFNKNQLEQVFVNFLVNAADAIESDGRIDVKIYSENDNAFILIEDNGSGIEQKHLSKLFEPFFTTKEVGKGTGLGLSISHGIITSHGGAICVDSTIGEGTKFTIKLPMKMNGDNK